ncbi:L,D-transpeptidase family protein [Promicromonospora iranensis]|uniref:L,D-transpeptidase family protein n=1 Tax=Promicromonospora iranensis TaxID=1105144 RepID=UPI0023A91C78|nr:L,D-transpeptidase family protein [Promicromonospora iranensis]
MHGRPTHGVGRNVGRKIMGTLGAVALAAGLLSACGDGQEPPADTAATSSPSPEESTRSQDPGAEEPEASPSEPSAEASGDGADEGTGDGASDDADDGTAAPDDAEGDAGDAGDVEGKNDGKRDDGSSEGDDGESDGKGENDDKGSKDEEPEKPDYIELGEDSDRVGKLQQRLKDLGYFVTSVDNAYGAETQQAVFALQKAGGLYRDGVVGDATQKAADDGLVPQAQTSSGKVLEIDIDRQLVLAVENGKVVKVINASSGNGETYEAQGTTYTAYTPRGSFAVYREVNAMHSSTLELGDMWRPKFFTGGIAVHGSSSVPAFPASHGCVRVSNSAMDWIWDTWGAPSGTPVVVY